MREKREEDGDERCCVSRGLSLWERREEKGGEPRGEGEEKNWSQAGQKKASARGGQRFFRTEATKRVPSR